MSISINEVISWFTAEEEDLYDYELAYLSKGSQINLDSVPGRFYLEVVDSNTERNYDSYGYSLLNDGYIIFSVADDEGNTGLFKLPVGYASYEGWTYYPDSITPTVHKEKVITTWEWADI